MAHLNEVRICCCYHNVLGRRPSFTEMSYWLENLRSGGREEDMWADLTRGYEFTVEAQTAFQRTFRRQPTNDELGRCRGLVASGAGLQEAVRDVVYGSTAAKAA